MTNLTYHIASNGKYWQAAWRDSAGRRKRKSLGPKATTSRKQAEEMLQRIIAEHAKTPALRDVPRSGQLGPWIDRYFVIREDELDSATTAIHRRTSRLLLEFFPEICRIDQISKASATDWRMWLRRNKKLGEATVCKHVRVAKVMMNRAVSEDIAAVHHFGHLKGTAPRVQVFDRELVTLELIERVVAAAGTEAAAMITIGYFTGMRTSEILHLQWDHIDMDRNVITVVPRGNVETTKQRIREVRIEPELWAWLAARERDTDTVLGMVERGRVNLAARLVKEACEAAGVQPFTIQKLRQTRDTLWHSRYPSHVACAWLGHSEATARKHYLSVPESMYSHSEATSDRPSRPQAGGGAGVNGPNRPTTSLPAQLRVLHRGGIQ